MSIGVLPQVILANSSSFGRLFPTSIDCGHSVFVVPYCGNINISNIHIVIDTLSIKIQNSIQTICMEKKVCTLNFNEIQCCHSCESDTSKYRSHRTQMSSHVPSFNHFKYLHQNQEN